MQNSKVFFRCINSHCLKTYPIDEVIYHCRACDEILKVEHNLDFLKNKSPTEWTEIFDKRLRSVEFPYNSGVWSKYEWIAPHIEFENIISTGEGYTPLFSSKRLNEALNIKDLFIKQCGYTHTGSFKDLGMTVLISHLKQLLKNNHKIKSSSLC